MERIKTKEDLQKINDEIDDIIAQIGAFITINGDPTDFFIVWEQIRLIAEPIATLITTAKNIIDQKEKEEERKS